MTKFTAEQRITQARMALMSHDTWCLYSGLLMLGRIEVVDAGGVTAVTNGRDIIFGRSFVETLTDAQVRLLLLHENEHKALRQLGTYKFLWDINKQLANRAADFVVNQRILDADGGEGFIQFIDGGCLDPKYRGWSTKQVFDDLRQQVQEEPKGEGKGGKPLDEHDFEGAAELSEEEQRELKKEIEDAVRQGGLLAGKNKGGAKNLLRDVLDSQIRWQEILAEFIKSVTKGRDNSSWAKVNRRWVSSGLYLPSSVSETVGGLLIAGDASGSTWSGNQLAGFLGEAKAIIDEVVPDFVDFVWWDTAVQKVWHFTPEDYGTMIEQIKEIQGGGGTRVSCVTDWIAAEEPKREYVAAIVLSDGQVGDDWGDWKDLPVLFCLNTKGVTAPVGQTLYIEN